MERIKIMVNGIPGNVAVNLVKHIVNSEKFELLPYSLTGPEISDDVFILDKFQINLIQPLKKQVIIEDIKKDAGLFISIDFTHPSAVNANAEFYCKNNLPFIMGTTGGNRKQLHETVISSHIPAVIAPNMAKQIVGFQAMMEYAAQSFPGIFKGYSLEIKESHQNGKADTSGTAKAMVEYFNELGTRFSTDEIIKIRDPNVQEKEWGVPEEFLGGHAWHTYTLISEDKTVKFSFTHNVNGRSIYAKGALDAVEYLYDKINQGIKGKVFSMIDVLKKK
ncbi:Dihydrodipicolinate reductase [Desulfonema limicola]|uniref:4-hydroxy-tetrahydrodipicolinate reductase n=1 Tax=Desulfonema limicola TaxID=45656 RepID=A0A975GF38_9BACT|nr:dihydrodipicolinate reductase [Desulfonema limicola]QTA78866.1 Dihydrodipicolinate reductase [Desulfonema limicola]